MGVTNPRSIESDTVVASPAAAAETVVCEIDGVTTRTADGEVQLDAGCQLTIGTSGTAVTLRIRRGSDITGVLVAAGGADTATAGNTRNHLLHAIDRPGMVDGQGYVLTAQVTGATAASTVQATALSALY